MMTFLTVVGATAFVLFFFVAAGTALQLAIDWWRWR